MQQIKQGSIAAMACFIVSEWGSQAQTNFYIPPEHLGWQCRQMCLSATPLKRQTFLSVADMSEMSSRHVGDILLCRPFFLLSASCRRDLLPTNFPTCT
jgi:hypothetical protein